MDRVSGQYGLERVFALWSGSYHLTKEASRFIVSTSTRTTQETGTIDGGIAGEVR